MLFLSIHVNNLVLHVRTHSFPTPRPSDLITLSKVRIKLAPSGRSRHLEVTIDTESPVLLITTPATLKRSGLAMRMVLDTGEAAIGREPDARQIGRAHV